MLTIIGFVSKALYNYPMGMMALIGLYSVFSSPRTIWNDQIQKSFIIVFLCLWLPLLMSFPDAVNQSRAAQTVFPYLRFLFAGLFIIRELSIDKNRLKFIIISIFIIVALWCIDASIQFFIGHNLLGHPYRQGDITGMFYPRNTISHICSILSAFSFLVVYQNIQKYKWLWLTLIPLFFVILVSGRRAAWLMLALSSFGFFIYLCLYAENKKKIFKLTGIVTLVISIALGSTIILHKITNNRVMVTMGLFSNDPETIDKATARRLPLWETAYTTFKANPINGIGPRGFRYVYPDYASPDNFYKSQTHPHLLTFEIMAETGGIGLLGYIVLFYLLIKGALSRRRYKNELPFLLPVLVALFPFNAHMAFYGSIWSSMIWWLMAVYFSSLRLLSKE
ncbi:MAG: O-antigen ligase family protein [Proteobacteria bacterium]|nr:O-antigen ligase family protein [Pseudomonadota bacterium]